MDDIDFDNPAFDRADNVDDFEDEEVDPFIMAPSDDAGIGEGSGAGTRVQPLQQEVLQTAVDNYYDTLAKQGLTPSLGRDIAKFELVDGRLRLKASPDINIINSRTGRPLAFSTVASRPGGGDAIRELGFPDWRRQKMSAEAVAALSRTNQKLGEAAGSVETVELQDLDQAANKASDAFHNLETTFTDTQVDELLETTNDPPLNLREIRGLDRALQNIRGELTNNLAKLTELDDHIALERRKLDEDGIDEFTRRRIAERLRELQDERASRLEAAAANREALRSQISRMRETINRILHEDTTLAERIRTLFREQGITIASILTAIGMAISALVFALTGSGGSTPTPPQPPSKGGVREWIKKTKLAGKAAAALPGIIGSIVSWLLTLLGKTVGWLAENLWALVIAVGGLLLVAAREWLLLKKPKHD